MDEIPFALKRVRGMWIAYALTIPKMKEEGPDLMEVVATLQERVATARALVWGDEEPANIWWEWDDLYPCIAVVEYMTDLWQVHSFQLIGETRRGSPLRTLVEDFFKEMAESPVTRISPRIWWL